MSASYPAFPRGTVTLVFTDIQGSSELWEQFRERFHPVLDEHNGIIREAAARWHGREVKTEGDAFFLVFARASEAVHFVHEVQIAFELHDWAPVLSGLSQLRVRIGVHTGEPIPVDGPDGVEDYFGPTVNRAARISAAAHGGQCLVSEATRMLATPELTSEITFADLGVHRLKGVGQEHLWQLCAPGLPSAFPPPVTLGAQAECRSPLPRPTLPIMGRSRELESWQTLLCQPELQLLTLTGIGGIGKTRLALELARCCAERHKEEFPDGVVWVELAEVHNGDETIQRLAYALNIGFQTPPSAKEQLIAVLRQRHLLLVLDNVEQIADAASVISELLSLTPNTKFLVTSRRALGLIAEHVREVPSLGEADAMGLFAETASTHRPEFALNPGNEAVVQAISERLEGVPLALVLAASRIGMGLQQILKRLDQHLLDLETRALDLPPRQRALRATIDWSYALLSDTNKWLFAQLAVFVGGFTYDDAEVVCEAVDVWEGLEELLQHSLLRTRFDATVQQQRLLMLDSLREYALEKLQTFGEAGRQTQQRHTEHYMRLAQQRMSRVRKPDEIVSLHQFEADLDNVRSAMQWCHDQGQHLRFGRLALVVGRFMQRRGSFRECLRIIEMGLESVRRLQDDASGMHAGLLGELLLERAGLHLDQTEWSQAQQRVEEALALIQTLPDHELMAEAHNLLGLVAKGEQDYDQALGYSRQALAEFRAVADEAGAANALSNLGRTEDEAGLKDQAALDLQAALQARQQQGDKRGTAETLTNLGVLAHKRGQLDEARMYYAEALHLETQLGYTFGMARALYNLGDVAVLQGHFQEAYRLAVAAARLFDSVGSPHTQRASALIAEAAEALTANESSEANMVDVADLQDKVPEEIVAWALSVAAV